MAQVYLTRHGQRAGDKWAWVRGQKPAEGWGSGLEAYLQVGELTKRLGTDIALILNLAVLLLQGVRKGLVTSHVSFVFNEIHGSVSAGGRHH